jgi:hypothetical protein
LSQTILPLSSVAFVHMGLSRQSGWADVLYTSAGRRCEAAAKKEHLDAGS